MTRDRYRLVIEIPTRGTLPVANERSPLPYLGAIRNVGRSKKEIGEGTGDRASSDVTIIAVRTLSSRRDGLKRPQPQLNENGYQSALEYQWRTANLVVGRSKSLARLRTT